MSPGVARRLPLSIQLIGVDGGASEVKVHEIEAHHGGDTVLRTGARSSAAAYVRVKAFTTPRERGMMSPADAGPIEPAEREQGYAWIEATAECVLDVAHARGAKEILLGVAMPGLKTAHGRGIAFSFHGPRIPNFLDELESRLRSEGLELAAPLTRLLGDGWCCGLGEEWAEGGSFRGFDDAYYVGGGTGVAESLKLGGAQVELDSVAEWFPKAWQLFQQFGEDFEELLSVRGINRQCGCDETRARAFPEQRVRNDEQVQTVLVRSAGALARLVHLRVVLLRNRGRHDLTAAPTRLGRVVIGQRLGQLLADPRTHEYFESVLRRELRERLERLHADVDMHDFAERLLAEITLPLSEPLPEPRWLVLSSLRAAPAIGAAAAALIDWSRVHA